MSLLSSSASVAVALSGGVDSSLTALLVKATGREAVALFMKNWEERFQAGACSTERDFNDAQAVANRIDLPIRHLNFAAEYWDEVFEHFLAQLRQGHTPNPDILCNRAIKFGICLRYAREVLGASRLATGHYARICRKNPEAPRLMRARDPQKDQTYFLHALNHEQLQQIDFPLGDFYKREVREMAAAFGLATAQKKDSTGICFLGKRNFDDFIAHYLPPSPGPMKSMDGTTLGAHRGLHFYTWGQRKGLHLGGARHHSSLPWFVVDKSATTNTLWVSQNPEEPCLWRRVFTVKGFQGTAQPSALTHTSNLTVKPRHGSFEMGCKVFEEEECLRVESDAPIRALSPGQYAVFYQGEYCLGGGIIESLRDH